ncbi:MAG: hypothetical protein LBD68_08170 [Zoogloeaceae bacterium]|nr:hypothetical protein [Zoogloeaceae bacterium]
MAAATQFPRCRLVLGVEINPAYAATAGRNPGVEVEQGNFFSLDWTRVLDRDPGPWLILGNPPWITNAELEGLGSANLPAKSNFQGHKGLDAVTGKANFDLSEWMLLQHLSWLEARSGWIAMLVKTSVARKVLRQAWKRQMPTGRAAIFRIDALHHFGASVDACFLVLPVNLGETSRECDVYPDLNASAPNGVIGFYGDMLIADVGAYQRFVDLIGRDVDYVWRSGVKHDCAKVMELLGSTGQGFTNGKGERLHLEETCLYPMLKSSDVAQGRIRSDRRMIVTQHRTGADTSLLRITAPKTWAYLVSQAALMDRRSSIIYRNRPRFSIFGVGDYTFAPWKVAISGFYKNLRFTKIGPIDGKPVVFDDTIYFLPCQSEEEADFILSLVQSEPYQCIIKAMSFPDEKRPVTAELLKRVSLQQLAARLGLTDEYRRFRAHVETESRNPEPVFQDIETCDPLSFRASPPLRLMNS